MTRRPLLPLAALAILAASGLAQTDAVKDAANKYALDLSARKATEEDFTKDTKKYGVEVFADGNTGDAVFISEAGSLAAVGSKQFKAGGEQVKAPLWQHGLILSARPAGELSWDKAKKFGVEVFKDDNSGSLVYVTEAGLISAVPARYAVGTERGKPKKPKFLRAMNLKVRKAGEKTFTKDTRRVGVEVFLDENNDNQVYVTEGGAVAVVPARLASKSDSGKGPDWQHGVELPVRKAGVKEIDKDTKTFGLEVFLDGDSGNLVYIGETGAIAVVPGKFAKATDEGKAKDATRKHAVDLSVRKPGQKEFAKGDRRFGVEVYADGNNDNLVYIAETGEMAVVSPKAE